LVSTPRRQIREPARLVPRPGARDVGDERVDAVDLVDLAVALGLDRRGEGQVAATRVAGEDEARETELLAMGVDPVQRGGAVLQAGGKRLMAVQRGVPGSSQGLAIPGARIPT
jgi:hypothetical protein